VSSLSPIAIIRNMMAFNVIRRESMTPNAYVCDESGRAAS